MLIHILKFQTKPITNETWSRHLLFTFLKEALSWPCLLLNFLRKHRILEPSAYKVSPFIFISSKIFYFVVIRTSYFLTICRSSRSRHWRESRSREILEEKWLRFFSLAREKLIFMSRCTLDFQESEEKFLFLLSIFKTWKKFLFLLSIFKIF